MGEAGSSTEIVMSGLGFRPRTTPGERVLMRGESILGDKGSCLVPLKRRESRGGKFAAVLERGDGKEGDGDCDEGVGR